jgi:hypothetical protein
MSNVATAGMIVALAIANLFLYFFMDERIQDRVEAILTGVLQGTSISTKDRWRLLWTSWISGVAAGTGFCLFNVVWFVVIGQQIDTEEVRLLAYSFSFFSMIGAAGYVFQGAFWYPRLTSVLRQAEAD